MQTKKYWMKDLAYGWKKMTGLDFRRLPKRIQKKATVVLFTKGEYPQVNGVPRKVLRTLETGHVYVDMPEDREDPGLLLEKYYTVFMKVPVKVGRFIP